MQRGDVVRVDLPPPKGPPGREQFGPRPAIVVQFDLAPANLSTVIIVPFTSNINSMMLCSSVLVKATAENGLDVDSVALVHQLRVIDKKRVLRIDGHLSKDDLDHVDRQMRAILGLV